MNKLPAVHRPGAILLRRRTQFAGWLFVGPATLLFLVFIAGPFVFAVVLALFKWDLLSPAKFIGFDNFSRLLADPILPRAVLNTFAFSAASIVTHIVLGLALALAANRILNRFVSYVIRVAVVFPFLISWSAVSLLWLYVLDPNMGYVSQHLKMMGAVMPNVFADPAYALPAIVLIDLWHTLGYTFIIMLAGLQTVPNELVEAARTDGANPLQIFFNVTLPLMSPTLFFAVVVTFIGSFQIFEPIQIITGGGPNNSTLSIVMYMYQKGFRSFDMGYAAAVALLVFVIIMIVTVIQFIGRRRWVHES